MKKFSTFNFQLSTNQGFTLIELLVAIGIIGILSSFLLANFVGVRQRARDGVRKSDLRQIQSALELYRSDKGYYPSSPLPACGSPLQDTSNPPVVYMQKIPCDPLGANAQNTNGSSYTYSLNGTTYTLYACAENINDKDAVTNALCKENGGVRRAFVLNNP